MKKGLITGVIIGLIIGFIIGSMLFNKTETSNNQIVKTRADSFSIERIENKNNILDISFSTEDCKKELYKRTDTTSKIKDLNCNISHTQTVAYGQFLESVRVMAFCYCDFIID